MGIEIKFTHHPSGALQIGGCTDWRGLPAVFALANCRIHAADDKYPAFTLPTDQAGLRAARHQADDCFDALLSLLELLGKMKVYVEDDELGASDEALYGWAVCGLSELMRELNEARWVLQNSNPGLGEVSHD